VSDFLYPFLDASERDEGALLTDLAASAQGKFAESARLRAATLERLDGELRAAAKAMAERFGAGGRLFTFGNGGSATDAENVARLFRGGRAGGGRSGGRTRPPLPARALVDDVAVVTAIGNDVGFDLVFVRQLIAHSQAGDIALGLSTSGNSRNLLAAFAEARKRGLLTVGIAGYDGGDMARSPEVDHCLVVHSDSVHRIQEAQAALAVALWEAVHA
jgi:D-sedoheptulose 7-phosphate isomerase